MNIFNFKKINKVKINCSRSFLARARCAWCFKPPSLFFFGKEKYYYKDFSDIKHKTKLINKLTNRMQNKSYLGQNPTDFITTKVLRFSPKKSFNPKMHHSLNYEVFFTLCVSCECNSTVWTTSCIETSSVEVINRKSRLYYSKFSKF